MSDYDKARHDLEFARQLAKSGISGKLDILLVCRKLFSMRNVLERHDPIAMKIIIGVASETDDLPLGEERAQWNPTSLALKDIEADKYRKIVSQEVTLALTDLLVSLEVVRE